MAIHRENACRRELNTLFLVGATRELTDGQLLERFATGHGKVAELAFAALVDRHGAMVERVCRAQLGDSHDAQDAFQATFLILVRKARTLWVRDSLGPWLHQVAYRTSSCARANHLRRQRHERRVAERFNEAVEHEIEADPEWGRVLHAEILRLPDRFRIPIVLCDLEGRTSEEAAREMNCPVGTVKSWRSRGRARLRQRLIRAGLSSTAAARGRPHGRRGQGGDRRAGRGNHRQGGGTEPVPRDGGRRGFGERTQTHPGRIEADASEFVEECGDRGPGRRAGRGRRRCRRPRRTHRPGPEGRSPSPRARGRCCPQGLAGPGSQGGDLEVDAPRCDRDRAG
ncbi:RNA polymerase sigma factor [Singulisphaera sp. PoT]|uniref:RNA polymerase sigma factor n=1 Tax=Singulisphaera sp. PoT TaxID=3411797 RepID=UPI003BF57057